MPSIGGNAEVDRLRELGRTYDEVAIAEALSDVAGNGGGGFGEADGSAGLRGGDAGDCEAVAAGGLGSQAHSYHRRGREVDWDDGR